MNSRNEELIRMCKKCNVTVRSDSVLAKRFLNDDLPWWWSSKHVVEEMKGTQRLYEITNYKTNLELGLRILAEHKRKQYPNISWKTLWEIIREYGTLGIKYATIRREWESYPYESVSWASDCESDDESM